MSKKPTERRLKPVEAIKRGQIDLVWQVVEGLRSGGRSLSLPGDAIRQGAALRSADI